MSAPGSMETSTLGSVQSSTLGSMESSAVASGEWYDVSGEWPRNHDVGRFESNN